MATIAQKHSGKTRNRLTALILVCAGALIAAALLFYRSGIPDDITWIVEEFFEPLTPAHESLHEGLAALDSGLYNQALIHFTKVTELDSMNAEGWYYRGVVRLRMNHDDLALKNFNRSLSIDSSVAMVYSDRGMARYFVLNDGEGAKADLQKALEMDQPDASRNAAFNLGVIYYSEMDFEKAIEVLNRSLEVDSKDGDALVLRGYCLMEIGKTDWAEEDISAGRKLGSELPPADTLSYWMQR